MTQSSLTTESENNACFVGTFILRKRKLNKSGWCTTANKLCLIHSRLWLSVPSKVSTVKTACYLSTWQICVSKFNKVEVHMEFLHGFALLLWAPTAAMNWFCREYLVFLISGTTRSLERLWTLWDFKKNKLKKACEVQWCGLTGGNGHSVNLPTEPTTAV